MGWLAKAFGLETGDRDDWQSGYNDGYADARTGKDYGTPAADTDQGRGGYAFGYGDGRQDGGWRW